MKRNNSLMLFAGLAVAAVPLNIGISHRTSAIHAANQARADRDTAVAEANDARKVASNQAEWAARHDTARSAIPEALDLDQIIDQLSGIAANTGVIWQSAKPQATTGPSSSSGGFAAANALGATTTASPSSPAGVTTTVLTIAVKAPNEQALTAFLAAIAQAPRLVTVDGVDLSWDNVGSAIRASIDTRVFSMPARPVGASSSSALDMP